MTILSQLNIKNDSSSQNLNTAYNTLNQKEKGVSETHLNLTARPVPQFDTSPPRFDEK